MKGVSCNDEPKENHHPSLQSVLAFHSSLLCFYDLQLYRFGSRLSHQCRFQQQKVTILSKKALKANDTLPTQHQTTESWWSI